MDKEVKIITKTLNELRAEYGLPPITGGDIPFTEVQSDPRIVRAKLVLEGAEEYIQKVNEIREATDRVKDSVDGLNAALKELRGYI